MRELEYSHVIKKNQAITLAGDSLYSPEYPLECNIHTIVIVCYMEPELDDGKEIWHNSISVHHDREWDAIYTDSGFKAEITNIVQSLVMDPEDLFQRRIKGELSGFGLEYTTNSDQHHNLAVLETGDWIKDWLVKNNGR